MARKLDDREKKLSRVISVKVTEADNSVWLAKVRAAGCTSAEFFRQAVLANRTVVNAIPVVDLMSLEVLRCYLRTTNSVELVVDQALAARSGGQLDSRDFLSVVANLSNALENFKREVRLAV